MRSPLNDIRHDLLLIGAGHAQVSVVRRFAMAPIPGVRLILINDARRTPYSGMLPGAIAGRYGEDDLFIDLDQLCGAANVEFIEGQVVSIDPNVGRVTLADGKSLEADTISINPGGAPLSELTDASALPRWLIPAKPIAAFWRQWRDWFTRQIDDPDSTPRTRRVLVVGAGAAGAELAFAIDAAATNNFPCQVTLVGTDDLPLPALGPNTGRKVLARMQRRGITFLPQTSASIRDGKLFVGGEQRDKDLVVWAAGVGAPQWLAKSGFACDARGFAKIDKYLRSVSHPSVFLTGDAVHFTPKPLPKAGVYSVRMGPVLADNIFAKLKGRALRPYRPQKQTLFLLGDGKGDALGWYAGYSLWHRALWGWKDRIDRKFMRRFGDDMQASKVRMLDALRSKAAGDPMRCEGCAAKIDPNALSHGLTHALSHALTHTASRALDSRPQAPRDRSPMGQDSGVFWTSQSGQTQWCTSIDAISSPLDDPFLHGHIAVVHALSDLYVSGKLAKGMEPKIAVSVTVKRGTAAAEARRLSMIMQGVQKAAMLEGAQLITGHSATGADDQVTVSVMAEVEVAATVPWDGASGPEWVIVQSQPLGIGVALAARRLGFRVAKITANVIDLMTTSNRHASESFFDAGGAQLTDVTGFGLVNHLATIVPSGFGAVLDVGKVLILPDAEVLAQGSVGNHMRDGIRSSIFPANAAKAGYDPHGLTAKQSLLFDPQTSGGVVGIIDKSLAERLGTNFAIIGHLQPRLDDRSPVVTFA